MPECLHSSLPDALGSDTGSPEGMAVRFAAAAAFLFSAALAAAVHSADRFFHSVSPFLPVIFRQEPAIQAMAVLSRPEEIAAFLHM